MAGSTYYRLNEKNGRSTTRCTASETATTTDKTTRTPVSRRSSGNRRCRKRTRYQRHHHLGCSCAFPPRAPRFANHGKNFVLHTRRQFLESDIINRVIGVFACMVGIAGLGLYSGYRHPIWIDEFLHFALGAFAGPGDAWQVIQQTVLSINFNQTGIYMMADFWLLKLFGADSLALRLPSLMSAAWLLVSTATLFAVRGFGNLWRLVAVLAILAQRPLMNFAAEARPYMPLAAAVVGTLAFYLVAPEDRRGWIFIVGVLSIGLGSLIHPYFPGYWAAVIAIGFMTALLERSSRPQARAFFRFCGLRLLVPGMAIYGIVGAITWMRGAPALSFDPFQWVHRDVLVRQFLDNSHLSFIFDFATPTSQLWLGPRRVVLYAMAALALALTFLPRRWRPALTGLIPPLLLALSSLVVSAILSSISYRHHYWILDRQWIASLALMPIAVVWYMAELGRIADQQRAGLSILLAAGCIAVFGAELKVSASEKIGILREDAKLRSSTALEPSSTVQVPTDNAGWVALANANIAAGGPVWPIFKKFYGR